MLAEVIYPRTCSAVFGRRVNRFTAEITLQGKTERVHVKNTGRLGELLLPGAEVTLQKAVNPARKTVYDLISVRRVDGAWVNIDSLVPNQLIRQYLQGSGFDVVRPEYTFGESRLDFYMEKAGEPYLAEVKGCTLVNPHNPQEGLFPDAPTTRGVKHLHELTRAAALGIHAAIIFVIQMDGVESVRPNSATQPEFRDAMLEAEAAGVQVCYAQCHVLADMIGITGRLTAKSI